MATVEEIRDLLENQKEEIVTSITAKFNDQFNAFKKDIEDKVEETTATVNEMKLEYDQKLENSDRRVEDAVNMVEELKKEMATLQENNRKNDLIKEYRSKMQNIIVGGFHDANVWEETADTLDYVNTLLFDILKVPNAHNIEILACHRLPRKPYEVKTRAQQLNLKKRPIIFKVAGENAKQRIFDQLKELKNYNKDKSDGERIYIDNQLPKAFSEQKKALLEDFKTARSNKRKAKWRVDYKTAEYCLYVNNKRVLPKKSSPNPSLIEDIESS